MAGDIPPGVNYDAVSGWFAANVPGGGDAPLSFKIIGDGRSNITYFVSNGNQTWVMRRPPLGHVIATAHDMAREYRVQKAVHSVGFPVPRMIALCEDTAINEYPFYVMEYRDGVIVVTDLPAGFADTPAQRKAMSQALVDTLVRLHSIDYNAVGLADHGRPEGYLGRQVSRWSKQWEANKTRELPVIDELIRRFDAHLPESPAPTIVHGDYRFGNMILNRDDPGKVEAVLDWEMSTLGDPLSDLGYTLVYWGNRGDPEEHLRLRPYNAVTTRDGFYTREEIVAEYARQTGRDTRHIAFYQAFANYKLGVITEGIYKRALQGKTTFDSGPSGPQSSAEALFNLALGQLEAAGIA
jgi:aminoglycoside phosphotransferase (APT) family kinase protein